MRGLVGWLRRGMANQACGKPSQPEVDPQRTLASAQRWCTAAGDATATAGELIARPDTSRAVADKWPMNADAGRVVPCSAVEPSNSIGSVETGR
ncbi:hypothetical protein BM1_10326 [Bipolaris maydis]|nr:hypothetical protein BM1_10326 [Bipolaris maydis]